MTLKELMEQGITSIALLPEKNDYLLTEEGLKLRQEILTNPPEKLGEIVEQRFHNLPPNKKQRYLDLSKLETITAYTLPLIAHDYAAKTPIMWNSLYEETGLNIKNIMLVADPTNTEIILKALKEDPKYIGGGAGVGFKESSIPFLDEVDNEIKAVNIIVKDNGKLKGYNTDSIGFVKSLEERLQQINKTIQGSNFIIIGAGGVAKDTTRILGEKQANYIAIANRTFSKAVALAHELNTKYEKNLAIGVGENMIRGILLNSEIQPDAIINLSDKGSDKLPHLSMFYKESPEHENIARSMVRTTKELRPELIYADIVLPSSGKSISLRIASSEGVNDKYLLDGKPMVVYQAAPAYILIQNANPNKHETKTTVDQALKTFKKVAKL